MILCPSSCTEGGGAAGVSGAGGRALHGGLEADLLEVRRRGGGEGAALAGRVGAARAGRQQRRAARHVLPRAAQQLVGRRGGHGSAARGGAAHSAREAALAELGGHDGAARALRVLDGAPAHLGLHHAARHLRLAGVGLAYGEDVPALRGQRFGLGLVLAEVLGARGGLYGLVFLAELHAEAHDLVSGARRQRGRAALALGVALGAQVRVLLALVRDLALGARVQRRAHGRRGLGPQARHRQLETYAGIRSRANYDSQKADDNKEFNATTTPLRKF